MLPTKAAAMVLGLMGLGLTLTPADAAPGGNRTSFDNTGTLVVSDLCPFPVAVTAHAMGDQTIVETGTGSVLRAHITETDTFEANGNSLTSTPYIWQLQVTFDADGNVVRASQTGMIVRVPLPDGTVFQVSGRANVLTAAVDYISIPTNGVSKNRDGLCAYLGS